MIKKYQEGYQNKLECGCRDEKANKVRDVIGVVAGPVTILGFGMFAATNKCCEKKGDYNLTNQLLNKKKSDKEETKITIVTSEIATIKHDNKQ